MISFANPRYTTLLDDDGSVLAVEDTADGSLDFTKNPKYVAKALLKAARAIQQQEQQCEDKKVEQKKEETKKP